MLYVHTEENNNVILGRKFIHYKFISYHVILYYYYYSLLYFILYSLFVLNLNIFKTEIDFCK
jgi:hypothetical protein